MPEEILFYILKNVYTDLVLFTKTCTDESFTTTPANRVNTPTYTRDLQKCAVSQVSHKSMKTHEVNVGENPFRFHNSTIFTGHGEIIYYCFHDQQHFSHVIKHLDTNSTIPRDRTNPFDLNELH